MAIIFVVSLLVLGITPRTGPRSVSAGSLDIRDVMPDVMMGAYKDYELVHLEEREEEDTIFITKRVDPKIPKTKECNDCSWFSPWLYSEEADAVKRDLGILEEAKSNMMPRQLSPRSSNTKSTKICKGSLDPNSVEEISLESYRYPTNEELKKKVSDAIYDFNPFDDPLKESYYQLKASGDFQNRNGQGMPVNRAVSVEHILEWQMLVDFIRLSNKRCTHMLQYFRTDLNIDTTLQVLTNNGKGPAKPTKVSGIESAAAYVAHQYPGDGKNGFANKFEYEFVSLHDEVNNRKNLLWSEGKSGGKKPELISQNTLTKWFDNKFLEITFTTNSKNKRIKSTKWKVSTKNQGLCLAVTSLRDILAVYTYHADPAIQKIMTAQVDRIGAAFEYLENGPLKTATFDDLTNAGKKIKYNPMTTSLKSQWEDYMKEKYTSRISEIEKLMETYAKKLEGAKVKRSLINAEKRGTGKTNSDMCGEESNKANMNKRIDLVLKAYKNRGKWTSPM